MLTYHDLTHHIIPGPQSFSYFIPHLLLPLALLTPRSLLSRWQSIALFMPIIVATTFHAWWSMGGVDVISVDTLLHALLLLVLKDPWADFRYVSRARIDKDDDTGDTQTTTGLPAVTANGQVDKRTSIVQPKGHTKRLDPSSRTSLPPPHEQPYPPTLLTRLPWVGTLLVSLRLNNWKINLQPHDRTQPSVPAFPTRRAFAIYALLSFARGYLILDLTRAYIAQDPYFTDSSLAISSPLPFPALRGLPPQLLRSMVVGAQAWALLGQLFYPLYLLPVGLHALGCLPDDWSPHRWAAYYGPPREIFLHGVRGFWGKYWHQTMRYSVSTPGYAVAEVLGLRGGSWGKYVVVTVVAFGLSGVVHMGLVPPEPAHVTMGVGWIRLCVAGFFWVQAVGIFCETLVARAAVAIYGLEYWQRGNGLTIRLVVNGLWVVAWFTLSLPLLAEFARQLGYWSVWPLPVSVWNGVTTGRWITWPCLER
ncbi:hypothetical protein LTR82_013211 [Friedmanniomyces endolithicus]|uniref:Wax synthase domain-containing protein n=1 Tax=Friedmanniomyces endolithicus TaxID=329885 RepID=A0AAN6J4H3_9PEZI|nr:hypothetical protein LTR82_013211 [Friedmanniomyces endolithicus]